MSRIGTPFVMFMALCAACGGGHGSADAGGGDDAVLGDDGAVGADADLTPGVVKATMLDPAGEGMPQANMPVVFINPDGSLVADVLTDVDGRAHATMLAGGSVTAVWHGNTGYSILQTVLAVKPGDDLVFGSVTPKQVVAGTFTVNFTPLGGTGNHYVVYGACPYKMTQTGSAVLAFDTSCLLSTMEIQVHAYDSANNSLGYLDSPAVPFVDGGSATMGTNWQQYMAFAAQYANIPAGVTSVRMERYAPDFFGYTSISSGSPSGATMSLSGTGPATAGAQVETILRRGDGSAQLVRQSVAGDATTYDLDVGANLFPWLGAPTLDPATGHVTVPVDAAGTSGPPPDLFRVATAFSRSNPPSDAGVSSTTNVQWYVFGPRAGDVTLPTMPSEIGELNPRAGDTVGQSRAYLFDADTIDGYDPARQNTWAPGAVRGSTLVRSSASP